MKILGIESSCDETSLAIIEGQRGRLRVKKHIIASQIKTHAKYGGVVPEVAARAHMETLFPLLEKFVPRSGKGIDAIAVTAGPGLITSLRVGVETAKTLAWLWDKPLVGVNHLEGHIYSNWLGSKYQVAGIKFPVLCLLVSGGHSELVLMQDHGKYKVLGRTRDDAAGEAFDKVAKLLGLGYPGGPKLSKIAEVGQRDYVKLPRPMIDRANFDFSFSGLKTAVFYELKKLTAKQRASKKTKANFAASFEEAVVDVLVTKTLRAIAKYQPKTVMLAGGVSANKRLRSKMGYQIKKDFPKIKFIKPAMRYTGDNAAMIAVAGYFRTKAKDFVDPVKLKADPNMHL